MKSEQAMMITFKSRLRIVLMIVMAALSTALIVSPVYVSDNLAYLETETLTMVYVVGMLVFVVVYAIWHFATRN